jgi:hypothetical protein
MRVGPDKLIVTGDTSYSGDLAWERHAEGSDSEFKRERGRDGSLSGRGQIAVSEVLLRVRGDELESVRTRGVLADGVEYDTELLGDDVVGREVEVDGKKWWVKARLDGDQYLGTAAEGWNVTNTVLPGSELRPRQ